MNNTWLNGSVYPDTGVPESLDALADRVDFLVRLCAAWDFGVLPNADTVAEIRREDWRPAVDACRLLTSPAYHLLRRWHGLPSLPYLGQQIASIRDDPYLVQV
ncbi:MAG: hypothetical protein AB1649_28995 [Chloroflexota bacterium]